VVRAHLRHLLLVALDTPVGPDVIPVDEALLLLLALAVGQPRRQRSHNYLPGDIHLLYVGDHPQLIYFPALPRFPLPLFSLPALSPNARIATP
jgi:hypothetical protein